MKRAAALVVLGLGLAACTDGTTPTCPDISGDPCGYSSTPAADGGAADDGGGGATRDGGGDAADAAGDAPADAAGDGPAEAARD